jgi:hypothetical protein
VEVGSLALRYLPFLGFLFIGVAVVYDARTRLLRPNGAHGVAILQAVAGGVMSIVSVVAIVVSPDLGLLSTTDMSATRIAAIVYLVAAAVGILTLIVGFARPASPHPRRGLTAFAFALDAGALAIGAYLLISVPSLH